MHTKIKNLIVFPLLLMPMILSASVPNSVVIKEEKVVEEKSLHLLNIRNAKAFVKEGYVSPDVGDFDCHSSSIIEVSPGVLMAVWKGAPGKGLVNIDIKENAGVWLSHQVEGKWSVPIPLIVAEETMAWSPVLVKGKNDEILLFCRIGKDPRNVITVIKRSSDGGVTWSKEEVMPSGFLGPTKSKPIITPEGTMICGSSTQNGAPEDLYKSTACWVEISSDNGKTWQKYGPIEIPGKRFGALSPALFYDKEGNLHMVCRDRSFAVKETGWIWQAVSKDGGKTWSPFEKTSLPNPDSGIDTVDLGEGKVLIIYNHSHDKRYPLTLAMTKDGGTTWEPLFQLEEASGEFPYAIQTADGLVHITYAHKEGNKDQRRIKEIVIDPSAL